MLNPSLFSLPRLSISIAVPALALGPPPRTSQSCSFLFIDCSAGGILLARRAYSRRFRAPRFEFDVVSVGSNADIATVNYIKT